MAAAAEFGWWPMSSSVWLSPGAAWFIVFNAVVGAIAVMESSRGQHESSGTRLIRTASTLVLDRLRSLSIFPFHSAAGDYSSVAYSAPASSSSSKLHHVHVHEEQDYTFQEQDTPDEVAPQLVHVREAGSAVAEEETVVLPQSAPVAARGTSATASDQRSHVEDGDPSSISFDEAYSLACARPHSSEGAADNDTVASVTGEREPPAEVEGRASRCRRGTEEVEEKAEVNARAERFIRQFREELKLERINSILNHTNALRRGAGAMTPR